MSVIGSNALAGASGQGSGGGFAIEKSLRFTAGDSAYLSRTPSSAGNLTTWTMSVWVKGVVTDSGQGYYPSLFGADAPVGGSRTFFRYTLNGTWEFYANSTNRHETLAAFRDPSAWYHLVLKWDTTNSTADDRCILYVNGVRQTWDGTFTANATCGFNDSVVNLIGKEGDYSRYLNGYLAEYHFIDGQALDVTDFGAFDDNGVWQAAAYSGTYGTNGFHLFDFANESGIGDDSSGNNNDFTVNNLSVDTASLNVNSYSPTVTSTLYGGTEAAVLNSTNLNDYAQIATPNYGTYFWQLELSTSIPITSSVKINMESGGGTLGNFVVRLNDNSSTDTSLPVTGGRQTVTLNLDTETSLTKFRLSSPSGSGYGTYLYYIMVDDVVLTKGLISTANHDVLRDSPTNGDPANDTEAGGVLSGNYCTWNPLTLWNGGGTMELVDGNLNFGDQGTASRYGSIAGSIAVNSGKWFVECTLGSGTGLDSTVYFGLLSVEALATLNAASYFNASGCIAVKGNAQAYKQGGFTTDNYASGIAVGDTLSIAFNCDDGTSTWYLNGTSLGSFPYTFDSSKSWTPFASDWSNNQPCSEFILNCGQRPFSMTPPTGYKAICTANLPTPDIADGSTAFDVVTYTSDGTSRTISGLNMSPDLVWSKRRSASARHVMSDSVRGVNKELFPNLTNVERTSTDGLTSFNSDGYTLGDDAGQYGWQSNGNTFVNWAWDAGSSTVSNTDGSITSSVRANQTAGFSIVSYTGTGANGTIGHGLNSKPAFAIFKTTTQNNWGVYHESLGATNIIFLNLTNATSAHSSYFQDTEPTSSIFTIGADGSINTSGATMISYMFSPVQGYSAFGKYTTGGANEPFLYLGFRPRFILYRYSNTTGSWAIWDTERSPYNVADKYLLANASDAEATLAAWDIVSNGLKPQTALPAGNTLIYAAFAENPFQANGGLAR